MFSWGIERDQWHEMGQLVKQTVFSAFYLGL